MRRKQSSWWGFLRSWRFTSIEMPGLTPFCATRWAEAILFPGHVRPLGNAVMGGIHRVFYGGSQIFPHFSKMMFKKKRLLPLIFGGGR